MSILNVKRLKEIPKTAPKLEPFPSYGDVMPIKDWLKCVESGSFIDYDGWGDLATADGVSDYTIYPSMLTEKVDRMSRKNTVAKNSVDIPAWATHIVWYNR